MVLLLSHLCSEALTGDSEEVHRSLLAFRVFTQSSAMVFARIYYIGILKIGVRLTKTISIKILVILRKQKKLKDTNVRYSFGIPYTVYF